MFNLLSVSSLLRHNHGLIVNPTKSALVFHPGGVVVLLKMTQDKRLFYVETYSPSKGKSTSGKAIVGALSEEDKEATEEDSTRRVCIAGATPTPSGAFIMQIARNLTDEFDGFLTGYRYLIMDRDTKFTGAFRDALEREGVEPVRCPPRVPTYNAYAERFVRSMKEECLDRMILLGERSLRYALREYEIQYLQERNHQGLGNQLLEPPEVVASRRQAVQRRERLGGLLSFYHREAA